MSKLTKEQLQEIQEYITTLPEEEREPKLKEIVSKFENEVPQCPFCLMAEGKIKTTTIYEDELFLAVLEINPANLGHTILITKSHRKVISELNEQETEKLAKVIKKISIGVSSISNNINIIYSEGQLAGQRFDHFMFNIIPRLKEDSVKIAWQPKQTKEEELTKIKQKIIDNFPKEKPKEKPKIDTDSIKEAFQKSKKRLP